MIAGSRFGGTYVWTDKRGGAHIIDLGTRVANSEISFIDDDNTRRYYTIPTIQNLNYSQSMSLPSHPTLGKTYLQQLTKEESGKLTFDIILADSLFTNFDVIDQNGNIEQRDLTEDEFIEIQSNENISIDEILNDTGVYTTKDLITIFEDMKNNSRVFTITTNSPMNDLLDNLVITSITYVHDKESRYIVACSIEAQRVHFAEIKYTTLTSAEVAGLMTEPAIDSTNNPIIAPASLENDGDQAFQYEFMGSNFLGDVVANLWDNPKDLHKKFGEALTSWAKKQGLSLPESYIKSQEINRKTAAESYMFSFQFPSAYGMSQTQEMYSSSMAPYIFYTKPIKFTFGKVLERKAVNIYAAHNFSVLSDIADFKEGTILEARLPITAAMEMGASKLAGREINIEMIDREKGIYDLVETYTGLGVVYNTEKRLLYKDINSKADAFPRNPIKRGAAVTVSPNTFTIVKSNILDVYGDVMGYKIKDAFPAITVSTETSNGIYTTPKTIVQNDEISWEFGSIECMWNIKINLPNSVNESTVKAAWNSYGVSGQTVTVYYGVLFVGALVLIVLFNPKVMNNVTRVNLSGTE